MCGRYTQTARVEDLLTRFGVEDPGFDLVPRYNLAPNQEAPVVGVHPQTPDTRSLRLMRWGLAPRYARDAAGGVINARAETLARRAAFRGLLPRRRCLVPADGFYEWRREGRSRIPMRFTLRSGQPFAFAGLWERRLQPDGAPLHSFTIVTTAPNRLVAPVHSRMPAILLPEDEAGWLDPANTDPEALSQLLKPYPADSMKGYRVSRAVNSPLNDSPECVAPDDPPPALLPRRDSRRGAEPGAGAVAGEHHRLRGGAGARNPEKGSDL